MAKVYKPTAMKRLEGKAIKFLIGRGMVPATLYVLSVRGRKSGRVYSTPVEQLLLGGERWLVAPYGEVQWVRNARAAGQVELSQKGKTETLRIIEANPAEAAPVLKAYITRDRNSRPYFDVPPGAPVADFTAEASRHPVFRLLPAGGR